MKRYEPPELVTWLYFSALPGLVRVTVTPGTTAPLVSVTSPAMPDVTSWARRTAGAQNRDTTRNVANIDESRFKVRFIVQFLAELTCNLGCGTRSNTTRHILPFAVSARLIPKLYAPQTTTQTLGIECLTPYGRQIYRQHDLHEWSILPAGNRRGLCPLSHWKCEATVSAL